jgi:hypothetical protein
MMIGHNLDEGRTASGDGSPMSHLGFVKSDFPSLSHRDQF